MLIESMGWIQVCTRREQNLTKHEVRSIKNCPKKDIYSHSVLVHVYHNPQRKHGLRQMFDDHYHIGLLMHNEGLPPNLAPSLGLLCTFSSVISNFLMINSLSLSSFSDLSVTSSLPY